MPLATQILRSGEPLELSWTDFHVAAMALAACFETGGAKGHDGKRFLTGPDDVYEKSDGRFDDYPDVALPVSPELSFMLATYPMLSLTPLGDGRYTLTAKHRFRDSMTSEILELLPGDVLIAHREM